MLADAAESLGARHAGRPAGSFGRAAVLSFNGNKIMTTSGGGMLLTDDAELAERTRYLATQARQPAAHYEHTEIGYNYRLSNVLAALGRAQLGRLDEMIRCRRELRRSYGELFAPVDGATIFGAADDDGDNCWLTAVLVDDAVTGWFRRSTVVGARRTGHRVPPALEADASAARLRRLPRDHHRRSRATLPDRAGTTQRLVAGRRAAPPGDGHDRGLPGERRSMTAHRRRPTRYDAGKRIFDLVAATGALVLSLPVLAITAVAVASRHGRPVIFAQQRPGRDGRIFTLYKFRTMRVPESFADPGSDADRLTPFGRWLRSTSLDELPTLWNVIRGDMSLVGPRPLLPEYLGRYTPEQARRHEVRPGITGYAQVHGRNAVDWAERLRLDVEYVDRRCARLDGWILAATVSAVLRRDGISAAGHATMPVFRGVQPDRSSAHRDVVEQHTEAR